MRYKFNPFTGRLSAPSPLEIPSKYGQYAEGPSQQFIVNTKIAVNDPPSYRGKYAPVPPRLQTAMRIFQMPNSLPVHIKGGPVDKMLFGLTSVICLVGLVECFRTYYTLAYPPAPK